MEVTINGDKVILKAGDPAVLVPRRVVHSIKGFPDEKLIFRERPDPAGSNFYCRFFNDVFSTGEFGDFWHILRAFYDGDSCLALPLYFRFFDELVSFQA